MSFIKCSSCNRQEEKPELVIKFYKKKGKTEVTYITRDMKYPKRMQLPKAVDAVRFNSVWIGEQQYKNIFFIGAKYANKYMDPKTK